MKFRNKELKSGTVQESTGIFKEIVDGILETEDKILIERFSDSPYWEKIEEPKKKIKAKKEEFKEEKPEEKELELK